MTVDQIKYGLSAVPWDRILSSVGVSKEVPNAVLGLLGEDEHSSESAYWRLDNVVVVQGSLYESAFYVIPFLVASLSARSVNNALIYELLYELANGASDVGDEVHYVVRYEPFVWYLPTENVGIREPLSTACRGAVLRGMPAYVSSLLSPSESERTKALELVASFREHPLLVRRALKRALEVNRDAQFAKKVSDALNDLSQR